MKLNKKEAEAKAKIEAHPAFSDMHWEDDRCFVDEKGRTVPGLWVDLKDGYNWQGCSSVHEANYSDALEAMEDVEVGETY